MKNYQSDDLLKQNDQLRSKAKRILVGGISLITLGLLVLLYLSSYLNHNQGIEQQIIITDNQEMNEAETSAATVVMSNESLQDINNSITSTKNTVPTAVISTNNNESPIVAASKMVTNKVNLAPTTTLKIAPTTTLKKDDRLEQVIKPIVAASKVVTNKVNLAPTTTSKKDDHLDQVIKQATSISATDKKSNVSDRYYIQFAALKDKVLLNQIQKTLKSNGLIPTVQSINTNNGRLYRLLVGPFSNKSKAEDAYDKIKNIDITAIIIGT